MKLHTKLILSLSIGLMVVVTLVQVFQYLDTTNRISELSDKSLALFTEREEENAWNICNSIECALAGSLERGEMDKFSKLLESQKSIEDLQEFSLYSRRGVVSHSTEPDRVGVELSEELKTRLLENPQVHMVRHDDHLEIYKPSMVNGDCIRCHTTWKKGSLGGLSFFRVSTEALAMVKENAESSLVSAKRATLTNGVVGAFGVIAVLVITMIILVRRLLTKPLNRAVEFVHKVAEGDYNDRLESRQKDEVGVLSENLNIMVEDLDKLNRDSAMKLNYLNNLPTPVLAVDNDFNIQFLNNSACELVETSPEEAKNRKCYELFKMEHCRTEHCCTHRAMEKDGVVTDETVADPERLNLPILYTSTPVKNDEDRIVGGLEYIIDIAAQKEVQAGVKGGVDNLESVVADVTRVVKDMEGRSKNISSQIVAATQAAEKMSNNMDSISSTAETSQNDMSAVATATEQMTSTVSEIARNSETARGVTGNAVESARQALERVNTLGAAASEIHKVIETIVEIAEQTKLLALNATIEAARAGEAGKGFAVVASEVKELAKQTNGATDDIRQKVEAIQKSSNGTISQIESINSVIIEVNDIVDMIATAVEEQNSTTRDMATNITHASDGVTKMLQSVIESAETAKQVTSNISTVNMDIGDIKQTSDQLSFTGDKLKKTGDDLTTVVAKFDQL